MPTVHKGESRSKYVSRCVSVVMRESGTKSRAHAVAKCHGMWKQAQKRKRTSNKERSDGATGVENLSEGVSKATPGHAKDDGSGIKRASSNRSAGRLGAIYPSGSNDISDTSIDKPYALNQRKRRRVVRFNPLRADPTRTTTLRRIFQQALSARFRLLKGKLLRLIVDEDAFGLRKYNQVQSFNKEQSDGTRGNDTGEVADRSPTGHSEDSTGHSEDSTGLALLAEGAKGDEETKTLVQSFNQEERSDEQARRKSVSLSSGSIGNQLNGSSSQLDLSYATTVNQNKELSNEQQSDASNSESNAASRERGKTPSELNGSPGGEASGTRGGEGKASIGQEDYVFALNQNKELSDDIGRIRADPGSNARGSGEHTQGERRSRTNAGGSGGIVGTGVEAGKQGQVDSSGRIVLNQRWAFHTNPEKVKQFQVWLQTQIQSDILTVTAEQAENAYWTKYVEEGYRKGAGRAFDDVNVAKRAESYGGSERLTGFYEGTREQFLQSSFGRPVAIEKVKLLTGRVFTELKGVTEAMATTITRELADGLVRGDGPRTIARRMIEQGIGTKTRGIQSRALTIARTETIRAHAEGQLDALEQMGVEKIGVMVEWSAAGDDRTCPRCQDLDGIIMKLKEARGIIPRHPNCRCSFIPANVGESTKGQIRGKADIQKAINDSIRHDIPKRTKRTLAEQKRRSRWAGADLKPSKVRPKPV